MTISPTPPKPLALTVYCSSSKHVPTVYVEESETLVPESRHLEAVEWLVELGSEIRAVNGPGDTALHAAAFVGYNTVAKFLLDGGAELNLKNKQGLTPYKIASGIVVTMMFFQHASTADFLRALGGVE